MVGGSVCPEEMEIGELGKKVPEPRGPSSADRVLLHIHIHYLCTRARRGRRGTFSLRPPILPSLLTTSSSLPRYFNPDHPATNALPKNLAQPHAPSRAAYLPPHNFRSSSVSLLDLSTLPCAGYLQTSRMKVIRLDPAWSLDGLYVKTSCQ